MRWVLSDWSMLYAQSTVEVQRPFKSLRRSADLRVATDNTTNFKRKYLNNQKSE
jgi:hypothetical protein